MQRGSGKRSDATPRPVTLKTVAESLKLSPATVSLVLNRSPGADSIPQKTQDRVFAAARRLNYRPNFMARALRRQRSFSVGVLVPEISEGYAAGVMSGVERGLRQDGYFYLVASHRSKPDLLEEYLGLLRDRLVEGFILVNTPLEKAPDLPAVAVAGHRVLEGVTNVVIDHDRAASLALSHLAELGHERIAFFKGHAHSDDTEARWQGILKAADSVGLEVRPSLTLELGREVGGKVFSPQEGFEEGYAFGQKLLAANAGGPAAHDRGFTAVFAFNDVSAIGAMRALFDGGLSVPGDVSVVGFDDIQSAAFQNPSLTTVRQPLREMGESASRILMQRLSGAASVPGQVTVEPQLMVRGSTGPPPGGTPRRAGRRGPAAE